MTAHHVAIAVALFTFAALCILAGVVLEKIDAQRRGRKFDDAMRQSLSRRLHPSARR